MRVRIYIRTVKGLEERHIDYTPPYNSPHRTIPSVAYIATSSSFSVKVSELREAVEILDALDKIYERREKKKDC